MNPHHKNLTLASFTDMLYKAIKGCLELSYRRSLTLPSKSP